MNAGVGSNLMVIIDEFFRDPPSNIIGVAAILLIRNPGGSGCVCKELAARMNRWGEKGCQEHREEIVAQLVRNAVKHSVFGVAALGKPQATRQANIWLDEAIRRSRAA